MNIKAAFQIRDSVGSPNGFTWRSEYMGKRGCRKDKEIRKRNMMKKIYIVADTVGKMVKLVGWWKAGAEGIVVVGTTVLMVHIW